MQTRCTLLWCGIGVALGLWAGPVCAQDDVPLDPELGYLPPAEDMPENEEEPEEAALEPGAAGAEDGEQAPSQESGVPEPASSGGDRSLRPKPRSSEGRQGQQSQVLAPLQLRIEAGPTDFALHDSGFLGEGRGLRMGRADLPDSLGGGGFYGGLGLGISVGVLDNFEVGVLQMPLILDNGYDGFDFGNIELHARYGFLRGESFELAVQTVVQVPTNNTFGFGLGVPVRLLLVEGLVIDTGIELEVLRYTGRLSQVGAIYNLDIPIAVNYYLTPEAFVGGRIGLFVLDFDNVHMPLGVQGGYAFLDGMVSTTAWFQWAAVPLGEVRYGGGVIDAGSFEFGVGCNVLLDFAR